MTVVTHFAMLGGRRVESAVLAPQPAFDAIDVVLRCADGANLVFGLRTRDYVIEMLSDTSAGSDHERWGSHVPLAIDFDPAPIDFWDFNDVLWLGPGAWPCIAWSNAEAFSLAAIGTIFGRPPGRIIAGPDRRGLPGLADVGLTLPDDLVWHEVSMTSAAR